MSTPKAEVNIDKDLIQKLLQSQHPDLAHLSLQLVDSGWDNDIYRLGKKYSIRLPRRKVATSLLKNEQTWLPLLAKRLPLPTPATLRIGKPEFSYPWSWSILPWLEGEAANLDYPAAHQAKPFAEFLLALHQPAPKDAPINNLRGVPLHIRKEQVEERLTRLKNKTNLITPTLEKIWETALATPFNNQNYWLHGDLHARNVLTKNKTITGIIDWGDMTFGDVSTDLASIWGLFEDASARQKIIDIYQPDDELLARAKGWAVFFGAVLLDTGLVDHPEHAAMGKVTLERLMEDS